MADIDVKCPRWTCGKSNVVRVADLSNGRPLKQVGNTHLKDGEPLTPAEGRRTGRAGMYEYQFTCQHCRCQFHLDIDY